MWRAVQHGFIYDKVARRKLLICGTNERLRETIRTLDDHVAEELNRIRLMEIEESRDQWVPTGESQDQ